MVLLLGAGVLMRTFLALVSADLGFDPKHLLVVRVAFPPGDAWKTGDMQFYARALERLRSVPEVVSVALSSGVHPFGGVRSPIEVTGRTVNEQDWTLVHFSSEAYLDTIGIRLMQGRPISRSDVGGSRRVALVNEALVKRYFDGQTPLGRSVRLVRLAAMPRAIADPSFEVIGVVRDVANFGVRDADHARTSRALRSRRIPRARVFDTHLRRTDARARPRTARDPVDQSAGCARPPARARRGPAGGVLRATKIQPDRPRHVRWRRPDPRRTGCLRRDGVYTISQQTKDIAIRIALGGERHHVLRMVFRSGLQLLAIGIIVGAVAGSATNRLLVTQLWNTTPNDPLTLACTVALVLVIGAPPVASPRCAPCEWNRSSR